MIGGVGFWLGSPTREIFVYTIAGHVPDVHGGDTHSEEPTACEAKEQEGITDCCHEEQPHDDVIGGQSKCWCECARDAAMPPNAIGGVGFGGNEGTIPLATVAMELGVWGPTFSKLLSSMIARNGGTEAEWLGKGEHHWITLPLGREWVIHIHTHKLSISN